MAGIASLVFGFRNFKKATHGDWGRYGVVAAQAANVTNAAADSSVKLISNGAKNVLSGVDNIGESIFKVTNASGKIARVASKAVNPLLVGAAAIRVARDEDKKSRAIEEGAALSMMFLGEGTYKLIRNTINQNLGKTLKEGQKVIQNEAIASKLATVAKKIGDFTKNSTGKQKALFIAAELAFVTVSILGYDLGKKLGLKITGRDKNAKTTQQSEANTKANADISANAVQNANKLEALA